MNIMNRLIQPNRRRRLALARWNASLKFTIERRILVDLLKAVGRRAPLRGRSQKMVRLSAAGPRVFLEANGKAVATEAMVLSEGACMVVHRTILELLSSFARGRQNITFAADSCFFRIDEGNWPVAWFTPAACPPAEFQDHWSNTVRPLRDRH